MDTLPWDGEPATPTWHPPVKPLFEEGDVEADREAWRMLGMKTLQLQPLATADEPSSPKPGDLAPNPPEDKPETLASAAKPEGLAPNLPEEKPESFPPSRKPEGLAPNPPDSKPAEDLPAAKQEGLRPCPKSFPFTKASARSTGFQA